MPGSVQPSGSPEDAAPAGLPRRLLALAAAAAVGEHDALRAETGAALAEGETPARVVEALLQLVPYAGFPRAITAFGAVADLLPAPEERGGTDGERTARGRRVFETVYGETAGAVLAGLEALDRRLARWTIGFAYGEVLGRDGLLDLRERELLAVSVLGALGGLEQPLLGHMRAAVRVGASADDVAGAVDAAADAVGADRCAAARALLARL